MARPPVFPLMGDTTTTAVVVTACDWDGNFAWLTTGGFVTDAAFSAACWVTSMEAADADTTGAGVDTVVGAKVAGAIRPCSGRRRSRSPGVGVRDEIRLGRVRLDGRFGIGFWVTIGARFGTRFAVCG